MTVEWADKKAPDLDAFNQLAYAAFESLPREFRSQCDGVIIRVAEFADDEILDQMGINNAFELTGLYEGVDLTQKSIDDIPAGPDQIHLYRQPILAEWIDNGVVTLGELIRHVLTHEIGHHFGLSDDDMDRIEKSP